MNPENEQVLERFAAGELSVTEENDFLARCEIDPARYRAATLALVEHRRISDALAEFTFPEDRVAAVVPSEQPLPQPNRSGSRTSLFALAATIAAVACGGYLLGMLGNREDNLQNIAVVDPTPVAPSDQQNLAVSAQQAPTPIDVNPFAIVPDAPASADRPADKTHDPRFVELPPEATMTSRSALKIKPRVNWAACWLSYFAACNAIQSSTIKPNPNSAATVGKWKRTR